ncbi:MAG: Maf family protein [Phycisphaerae bacterium]
MMNGQANHQPPLILASTSPRRRRLLSEAGYAFRVLAPPIHEPDRMGAGIPPTHQAEALSYFKARSVLPQVEEGLILAADTVVACQGEVYGKPVDRNQAGDMLKALLGSRQQVITGVTLLEAGTGKRQIVHATTLVVMRTVSDQTIERYLDSGDWMGKAGGYGIQGRADAFVERIEGSFTNVVGLPMELLTNLLTKWGYSPETPAKDPATR